MPKNRKADYGVERRGRPSDRKPPVVCQGGMGMCKKKTGIDPCKKCARTYCGEHMGWHLERCLGWG